MIRARFERDGGLVWLHTATVVVRGRTHLEAVEHALKAHRVARNAAEATELRAAGWLPSPRRARHWDDPQGKYRACPQWRALEIARRDNDTTR